MTKPNQLDEDITKIFITIDNYGTAQEARDDIKSLIAKTQIDGAKDFVTFALGERCKTRDLDELKDEIDKLSRCPVCEMWDEFDEWLTQLNRKDNK